MTSRDADRYVARCMAISLMGELDNGSEWIFYDHQGDNRTPADTDRVVRAVRRLIDKLGERGGIERGRLRPGEPR